jgi:hypothetical protein
MKLKRQDPRKLRRLFRIARQCKRTAGGLWHKVPGSVHALQAVR